LVLALCLVGGKTHRGPLTPVVATLSDDEKRLLVILANGSWDRAVPCRIDLRDFAARRAEGIVLSHSDPDGYPLLERKEDLIGNLPVSLDGPRLATALPPHAVAFITLER
jgi:hypothetical protein